MEDKKKEEFKALAVAMKPIIEEMWAVLKEHKVEDLACLSVKTDGYVWFRHGGTDWELSRYVGETELAICNNEREVI